nr:retrotransposon protein, putative, Ty1-copia subclass [Tanacetum cinerariifolium]
MLFTMRETYVDRNLKVIIHFFERRIASAEIIDYQLPSEYTITSRSTNVVVPLPAAPAADSVANVLAEWNAIYDAYNDVACLILGSMTPELHRQFENSSPYDMIKELKSMFEKQAGVESNGIYEIDMHDLVPNVNSIYNVSTKRAKHNLDSIYLWHCCLAHISKKRIEKLQQEGLLRSTDDESIDQCVSCLSEKMTRKLFPHRPKRAIDLLGIIHTNVCGPLRHVSRQGASYFITFTDDHSRYGYVYLLKHKHEVFETFKVFKNEVENQIRKTIKAL